LQNALHRASVVCQHGLIRVRDLPKRILDEINSKTGIQPPTKIDLTQPENPVNQSLENVEKQAIEDAIKRANGNLSEAIRQLGIGRATFYRKMKKFNLK
jgi:transcriptional regulator of acetoin/glycerol metabolism